MDEYALLVAIPTLTGRTEPYKSALYFGTIPETVRDMPVDFYDGGWREKLPRRLRAVAASAADSATCAGPIDMHMKLEVQEVSEVSRVPDQTRQPVCQCVIL